MPPAPSKAKFADGEKLLCYHGPLLYEAKCVRSKKETGGAGGGSQRSYFVHYLGWNKNWDEWVGESRVLKINPENLEKKSKLLSSHMATLAKEGTSGSSKKKQSSKLSSAASGASGNFLLASSNSSGSLTNSNSQTPPLIASSSSSSACSTAKDGPLPPSSLSSLSSLPAAGGSSQGSSSSSPLSSQPTLVAAASAAVGDGGGKGGSDSGNTSRASTPVSERSYKAGGGKRPHIQEDDLSAADSSPFPAGNASKRPRLSISSGGAAASPAVGSKRPEATAKKARKFFNIEIPEELKYVLVSDWDLITHKRFLFSLPAKIPVSTILAEYLKQCRGSGSGNYRGCGGKAASAAVSVGAVSEAVEGLLDYFDAFVGTHLLYKLERQQYDTEVVKGAAAKAGGQRPSDIYGSAHLLRMMVKMGSLLDQTMICPSFVSGNDSGGEDEGGNENGSGGVDGGGGADDGFNQSMAMAVRVISDVIHDLLAYLEDHLTSYFTSKNYIEAPSVTS